MAESNFPNNALSSVLLRGVEVDNRRSAACSISPNDASWAALRFGAKILILKIIRFDIGKNFRYFFK